MKKLKLLLCLFCVVSMNSFASSFFKVDGINYRIAYNWDYVEIVHPDLTAENEDTFDEWFFNTPSSYSGNLVNLPTQVNGFLVKGIGAYAFYQSNVSLIKIPNSVTSIGYSAFHECKNLSAVVIPNSVTSIGGSAFYRCSSLASITIPNSVTWIGDEAFSGCSSLASIKVDADNTVYDSRGNCNAIIKTSSNELIQGCKNTIIPNSAKRIGIWAFMGCSSLSSITIPNSVTSIGGSAFSGCSSLASITIPNSVTSIGGGAFSGCSSLASVSIGNSVTSIGDYAFSGCSSLSSVKVDANNTVYDSRDNCNAIIKTSSNELIQGCNNTTIPNSVTSIGERAFRGCSSLATVTIPNSVTSIDKSAFSYCSSLASVSIGNSVTSIGDYAFSGCSSLSSVSIGNSVTSIGDYAFSGCTNLTEVHINSMNSWCNIKFANEIANPTSNAHKLYLNNVEVKDVVIPETIDTINAYAFYGCSSLTSITIPNSVKSIGEGAFYGCSSLSSITIPNSVARIENYTFNNCHKLSSITLGNSTTSIGNQAFCNCKSLTSISIPSSVREIKDYAFLDCYSLNDIYNYAVEPQVISDYTFYPYSQMTLHVLVGRKDAYSSANNWSQMTITDDIQPVKATSIEVDKDTYYCTLYETMQASATVSAEATVKQVKWTSSDPSCLTVIDEQSGEFFGLSEGVVTITATTMDGTDLSASAIVYVGDYTPVSAIALNQTSGELNINETLVLSATVAPETASLKTVKWSSSNAAVATVSESGLVTALAPGNVTITATSTDGTNIKADCVLTVKGGNFVFIDGDNKEGYKFYKSGDDAEISDTYKRLEINQTIEDVNVTYNRSFDSKMVGNWQAWFMPFDVDYDDMSDDYEVAQIYGVLMDKAGVPYIAFQKMTEGLVKANVPYAVRVKEAGDAVITTTTTLQQTANTNTFSVQSTANNFTFGGVYENSYLSAEYPTYALNKSGNFALMASSVYLRPFRIYMRITDREDNPYAAVTTPQEVKVVVLGEDETSIDEIHNAQFIIHNDESSEIYNLGGQKLQKLQKGINIVNGKKVLF